MVSCAAWRPGAVDRSLPDPPARAGRSAAPAHEVARRAVAGSARLARLADGIAGAGAADRTAAWFRPGQWLAVAHTAPGRRAFRRRWRLPAGDRQAQQAGPATDAAPSAIAGPVRYHGRLPGVLYRAVQPVHGRARAGGGAAGAAGAGVVQLPGAALCRVWRAPGTGLECLRHRDAAAGGPVARTARHARARLRGHDRPMVRLGNGDRAGAGPSRHPGAPDRSGFRHDSRPAARQYRVAASLPAPAGHRPHADFFCRPDSVQAHHADAIGRPDQIL